MPKKQRKTLMAQSERKGMGPKRKGSYSARKTKRGY